MTLQAAAALVAEFVEMLPPPSSTPPTRSDAEPPWIEEFVSARVLAARARANMGWAVEQILRAAAARCVHCTVGAYLDSLLRLLFGAQLLTRAHALCRVATDQLSGVVLPPIIQRIENTLAEREENRFEASQVRRAAMQAGAKVEGAKSQTRSKHFAKIEKDLRTQLRELEQADSRHADMMEQLQPLRDFLKALIRTRLEVDPAKLQIDVDRMLALGLNGKDLSMEGSGTILHTAAEAGQTDAIRGWLQLLAGGDTSDSDDDDTHPVVLKGTRVAVVETSSPHFGNGGIVMSVSRTGLVNVAFDDGTSSRLQSDHVVPDDQKTDAEVESERAYLLHARGPLKYERLGAVHIDARSPNGATPLYAAAYAGHVNVVALLLQEKADVNAARDDGCTAMHAAARNGHCEVVEALVEGGADLNRPAKRGVTPLCMLLAGLERARLCAEAKAAPAAGFAQRPAEAQAAAPKPMSAKEFGSGQALVKESADAWTKVHRLEQTLRQFVDIGRQVSRAQREAQQLFRKYDKDHSDHLSKAELSRMFDGRVEKRTDKAIRTLADYTDRDGGIQWGAFWRWWWNRHITGLWLPATTPAKPDISDAMELGYKAAFMVESVEALWRDRVYTGMMPLLEGMVAQARSDAKSAEARALAESEERQEKEYARQQAEWQKRMQAASEETRRKRTAIWRTGAGQALLETLQDAQAAELISEKEVGKLKLKVQSGITDAMELQRIWKRKWLLHCTHKGIASANSAPLKTKREKRQPVLLFLDSSAESSDTKENTQPSAPWFDVDRQMFGSLPAVALQAGLRPPQPDGYDRRRILTKGILYLVDELHAQSSDNRALALYALAVLCGPNTREGIKSRRLVLGTKAAEQIASLVMHRGARQSEVNLFGPAVLAMLIYEDKSIASIIQSTGCIGKLVHLIEPGQHVEIRMSVLRCLVNLAVDSTCRRECRRLELVRFVRPLCLEDNEVGNIGVILLDCLNEQRQSELAATKTQMGKHMLSSPSLPSVCTSESSTPVITSAETPPRTLSQEEQGPQSKTGMDGGAEPDSDAAVDGAELEPVEVEVARVQSHSKDNGESAWATESFAAFSFVDNLQAVKPTPKFKIPARPLHMLGVLLGHDATKHDLEKTFNAFDANGDGVLSAEELKNGLLSLGVKLSTKEIDGVMTVLDTDGNGEVDRHEFCRQFQRWTGRQLSEEEERTIRWHSKPTRLARRTQIQPLREAHSIKPPIDEAFADDHIDRISQAIVAERDTRMAKTVARDRKRIRAAVTQVHKVYRRSDELALLSKNARDQKIQDVEDARRGVRQLSRQQHKLLSEIQRMKDKTASLLAAASHGKHVSFLTVRVCNKRQSYSYLILVLSGHAGGFVHRVDLANPSGTPTVARRWLELGHGELLWRFGREQLLDEAVAVSKSIRQPQESTRMQSALSTKTVHKSQLEVEDRGDDAVVPGWVTEARKNLRSEKDESALWSPPTSPLPRLSPLSSPAGRSPKHCSKVLSPSSTRSDQSPTSRRRRRADIVSWDSPLGGAGSNLDVLSVAELALSVVTQEPALTCCTEVDAAEYMEELEKRQRLRESALEADRPMPTFESLALKTTHTRSYVLRVVLGTPDSAGFKVYTFCCADATEVEKWKVALKASIKFHDDNSQWDERLQQLHLKSIEVSRRLAVWERALAKAEHALEETNGNAAQIQEACTRAEDLVEWSVADELARTTRNQAQLKAEKLTDALLGNEFWPGTPFGPQRVASMLLADGQSVH